MNLSKIVLLLLFLFLSVKATSQFSLDAEVRPRFEYRHGYKTLFPDNTNPAAFVSQRTRLNFSFRTDKLHLYLSPQDVRVWGDVPQLNTADENGLSLHQAWAEIVLVSKLALKAGRQEIIYDDQRILGNVGWAQQGRSHDAALLKYHSDSMVVHVGAAYNQDGEKLTDNTLTTNTYKSLQYVWLHKEWEKVGASFLFLNNGLQYIDTTDTSKNNTRFSQTAGVHLKANANKFNFGSNLFYQFGKDLADNDLSAYLISLQAKYSFSQKISVGLGGEFQSGNDNGAPANGKNNAFNPLYGTNHKFNGYMDYYYVGNHIDNVGLVDLFGNLNYSFHKDANINLGLHKFFAASSLPGNASKDLGFEFDFVTSYQSIDYINLQIGYSQYFAAQGIEIIKNNFDGNTNNWAWIMVTVDPVLFTWPNSNFETK